MLLLLRKRLISWRQRLKRKHTEDRKNYRSASPPIKLQGEITSKNEQCLEAQPTKSALPLILVTDVDGKLAVPDSW